MEPNFQPFLYLLYLLNTLAGVLLGRFLYREYQEGFMVLIRERVLSLRWVVVPLLLLVSLMNLFWLYKIRGLEEDLLLLLLIFAGVTAPFLWIALVALLRFLFLDVLMGFLAEVSESLSGLRQTLKKQSLQKDLKELQQHDSTMDKIRKVRHQWAKRMISRKDAVDKISKIKKKEGPAVKRAAKKKRPPVRAKEPSQDAEMPTLMSSFVDKLLDQKGPK